MSTRNQLGTLLLERGLVTQEQLDTALEEQRQSRKSLGRVLIDAGIVSEGDLVSTLAARIGLEFVDLGDYTIDPSAVALISDSLARRFQAVPVGWDDNRLVVAMADPSNVVAIDDIRTITGAEVKTVVATRGAILEALDRHHRMEGNAEDVSALAASEMEADDDLSRVKEVTEDAPIVKLVNLLISQAVADRASDIHIEPTEVDVRVRYRIDGVLHEVMRSPKNIQSGLISRLKIMADLNIAERRVPQDGRMSGVIAGKAVDLRVATLPTVYGEKVVMRILDKSTALLDLRDLGFDEDALVRYETAYRKPYGTILVTGPTGSGKSTTLYATLNAVNDTAKNIITVEDPVEYRLAGINQVQVNTKAGLTFAVALRTILRSDPDIVLLGEVRDKETATIAIEAALTGHLVLTTLHTNDASSTPTRLVEMGVEPFLVGSALDCIVAQRLARRLCPKCKDAYVPEAAELETLGWDPETADELPTLYRAAGCGACGRTGFHGRFSIQEVLLVTEEVERLIVDRAHTEDIKKVALAQGMKTLRQTGLAQALAGTTSIEEILRVVA
ncbi:MAG: type II secretion system protein GspE [Actinobacteria bacterium]|nr:MAG: type II secretion system protein GspE [Actinomycetota bacterium]